jgi:hypothetical protein
MKMVVRIGYACLGPVFFSSLSSSDGRRVHVKKNAQRVGGVLVPISNACVSGASRSVVPMMHLSRLARAVKTWIAGIQFYPTMLASYRQAVRAILH